MQKKINPNNSTYSKNNYKFKDLLKRKWPPEITQKAIPDPDFEIINDNSRTKYYLKTNLHDMESTLDFNYKDLKKIESNVIDFEETLNKQAEDFIDYVMLLKIKIPYIERNNLEVLALENYNTLVGGKTKKIHFYSNEINNHPLREIILSYILYEVTSYGDDLINIKNEAGLGEQYRNFKYKLQDEINFVYPWL